MKVVILYKDWKSWFSIIGLTLILLLFGLGKFQQLLPIWFFIPILLAVNWLSYSVIYQISLIFKWNQNLLLNAFKHFFFAILSSILLFSFSQINANYYTAYFSGFLLVGVVFTSFDYLLTALEELSDLKQHIPVNRTSEIANPHFQLFNSKGRITFDVSVDEILCFEANDNYLTIHYLENGVSKRSMERLSIRKAEEMILSLSNDFVRVHKSFLVNQKQVKAIVGKSQNYRLQLSGIELEVPVSRRLNVSDLFPSL